MRDDGEGGGEDRGGDDRGGRGGGDDRGGRGGGDRGDRGDREGGRGRGGRGRGRGERDKTPPPPPPTGPPVPKAKPSCAYNFLLTKEIVGEKNKNQIKAAIAELFGTYGAIDECKVVHDKAVDTHHVTVYFSRLFIKGQQFDDALKAAEKNMTEKPKLTLFDSPFEMSKHEEVKGSGGGRFSGTAKKPSKKPPPAAGRGRGAGDKDKPPGKEGEKKPPAKDAKDAKGGKKDDKAGGKKDDKAGGKKDDKAGGKKDDKKDGGKDAKKDDKAKGGDKKDAKKK